MLKETASSNRILLQFKGGDELDEKIYNLGDEHSSSNYCYLYCDECCADTEDDCKCVYKRKGE